MNARLDRGLTRLYRLAGAALFLVLCGHASYTAGARSRDAAEAARPANRCRGGAIAGTAAAFARNAPQP